jgi:hypothetical protein
LTEMILTQINFSWDCFEQQVSRQVPVPRLSSQTL